METVFLKLVNLSITASWLILAVVVLRILLRKAPKSLRCILWALVGIRLVCPLSLESALSLIPSAQTVPETILSGPSFSVHTGFETVDTHINAELADRYFEGVSVPANTGFQTTSVLTIIWLAGIAVIALYAVVSCLKLRKQTRESIAYDVKNVWLCDRIASPFIFGIIKPRIFLPAAIREADIPYVIAHEKAHLKRCDHLWKPLGFAILSIYWFNPVIWMAYILLCRDIELACDEKVVKAMGASCKKPYADALINCSVTQKMISACPVAFGENDIKIRIQSILHYKKPAFWLILTAVASCVAVAVCFLTVPKGILLPDLEKTHGNIIAVTVTVNDESYTTTSRIEMSNIQNFIQTIYVDKTVLSESRSTDREKNNAIIFHYNDTDVSYFFNGDCTALWIDNTVKPSYTYSLKKPKAARLFFEAMQNGLSESNELKGLSLRTAAADFAGTDPYLEIEWINRSEQNLIFGEGFAIYQEKNGIWEKCNFPENYGFDLTAIPLPANTARTARYSMEALRITEPGKYVFEASCSDDVADNEVTFRQEYTLHMEFELTKNTNGGLVYTELHTNSKDAYTTYTFADSVDFMKPKITLSQDTNTFQFTFSVFSSYLPVGTYDLTDDTLTLRTADGENVYVFHAQENGFAFDAAQSSPIPQYKYSGASKETQSPVPDGARFTLESIT